MEEKNQLYVLSTAHVHVWTQTHTHKYNLKTN